MKKDIGSIFPIYDLDLCFPTRSNHSVSLGGKRINFSLCREALYAIAKKYSNGNRRVLLPAYTCQTVIDPFLHQGWSCSYYNIQKNLRIDIASLSQSYKKNEPAIVVVHPYLGMDLNEIEIETLTELKNNGCILVNDLTQCIYSNQRNEIFDYYVGSYRKWINIPDGGFIEGVDLFGIESPDIEYSDFVNMQTDAMYLRGQYFQNGNERLKSISIRLNKAAVKSIGNFDIIHRMSDFSQQIWINADAEYVQRQRMANYRYLYKNIRQSDKICFITEDLNDVTTAPLYFPIYVRNRGLLQKQLIDQHIYAPILWPIQTPEVLINDNIKYIYDSILMIPIDQRYNENDMNRIIETINSHE